MAIFKIEYYSEVLGMNRPLNVIYPESSKVKNYEERDIPVLYLLHGMSGNENHWLSRSGIDRLVRHTNLAVVMPSTDLGFYTNTTYGMAYFDAIALELPKVIHHFFPNLSTKRERNFIAGLSMGGYGAFKLALATNQFSYAASLSGALAFKDINIEEMGPLNYWEGIFGPIDQFETSENNLLQLAKRGQALKPKLYAWCGVQDSLIGVNNYAVSELKKAGYDVCYETSDGIHDWYYWTVMIDRVLEWLPIHYQREERMI